MQRENVIGIAAILLIVCAIFWGLNKAFPIAKCVETKQVEVAAESGTADYIVTDKDGWRHEVTVPWSRPAHVDTVCTRRSRE
jgi:hypothetical protein